jgi:hypothetical protein
MSDTVFCKILAIKISLLQEIFDSSTNNKYLNV